MKGFFIFSVRVTPNNPATITGNRIFPVDLQEKSEAILTYLFGSNFFSFLLLFPAWILVIVFICP